MRRGGLSLRCSPARIGYIDGLRALAVVLVVVCHTFVHLPGFDPYSRLGQLLHHGMHGVDLFFVLSGFCLAHPTLARLQREGRASFDVARYAARRIVRILPPFYAAILLFAGLSFALRWAALPLPDAMPQHGVSAVDVVRQALFLDDNSVALLNGSFWTLPIEFRWYFLMPVALLVWVRSPRALLLGICAVVVLEHTRADTLDLIALPAFLLGIVAADADVREHPLIRYAPAAFLLSLLAALATTSDLDSISSPVLWNLSAFFFVLSARALPNFARLLSAKWLTCIGAASYSIYLIHQPFIELLERQGAPALIAALAAIVAGILFWWIAERPFVQTRLRDRFVSELERFLPRWLSAAGLKQTFSIERGVNVAEEMQTRTAS